MGTKHFSVDARAMLTWGRDSIKDHTTAILELIKNSYDAGASVVEVVIRARGAPQERYIRISDDGCGMTEEEIDQRWLRIGYSDKLNNRFIAGSGSRRKTGEKGIGRISADRLGAVLELRSQAPKSRPIGLKVSWSAFEMAGNDISSVTIPTIDAVSFDIPTRVHQVAKLKTAPIPAPKPARNGPAKTGTELTISGLRHAWTSSDIKDLHSELSVLTSPFGNDQDFQIRLNTDLDPKLNGVVTSAFYETAAVDAEFEYKAGQDIQCTIRDREDELKLRVSEKLVIPWQDFIHPNQPIIKKEDKTQPSFGPVSIKLLFFPRKSETVAGTGFSVDDLRTFLDINAGIKVYRDNIRVMPYGSQNRPEGDWLGLGDRKTRNPAGAGRADFRVGPDQIVGAVFLGRDTNPRLVDTSGREGLIHSDEFYELKAFLYGCLVKLESHYHNLYVQRIKRESQEVMSPREAVTQVSETLKSLSRSLKEAERQLPQRASRAIARVKDQISTTENKITSLQKSSEALVSQATVYRSLASLGIASAVFAHETESSIDEFLSSTYTARTVLKSSSKNSSDVLGEVEKAIKYAERVAAWGVFALSRVKRDKRARKVIDISELASDLIQELKPVFEASNIALTSKLGKVKGRTFPMDVESVLLNLLTNAYYFAKQKPKGRAVHVEIHSQTSNNENGFKIIVSDSGPGVRTDIRDQIWEPLFTTKVDGQGNALGTGLGLSIVNSVVKDLAGSRSVDADPVLHGARFNVWLRLL